MGPIPRNRTSQRRGNRAMVRNAGGVALASIALMALCCVVVLHVNDDHAIKMDVKEGHDVYDSDMDNLMELLQETAERKNEDDLTGEEKALINAAGKNDDPAGEGAARGEPMLHWSDVEDHEESMGEPEDHHDHHPHNEVHSKAEEDNKDSLNDEDKALITAANGRTLSLTPKKKAVQKLAHMKHTSYATPKAQKKLPQHLEAHRRPLVVQQEMPKEKPASDPQDELSNEDKALLAGADGLAKPKTVKVARKVVKKPHKVAKKHTAKKVVKKAVHAHKMKAVKAKKALKKAPVQMMHHSHHVHQRHGGKDGLSNSEKALLAAADAGAAKSHHKKAVRKMMHHAKKTMKKVVHRHMAHKKAPHKHNKAKLVAKKQPRKAVKKAVKLPSAKHLRAEVKADNLEMGTAEHIKSATPKLPKAM